MHRHPGRVSRRGAARDRQGQRDRRPSGRGRVSHRFGREGVPDGAGWVVERRHRPLARSGQGDAAMTGAPQHHILSVLVENKSGVLARIASLFARRGYNIFSLAVAPTEDERFSRITIVVDVESAPLEQIVKQLYKLVNVVKILEVDSATSVERELLLAKVHTGKASSSNRSDVMELVQIFE